MKRGYEQHYKHITPPKGGMGYQRGQLTPLHRSAAKVALNCDHCGLLFEKYSCWAKRSAHHYCGRVCANAAKVIRIPKPCIVCGAEMLLTPSGYQKISTCCRTCSRKRRVANNANLRTSPDYIAITKRLKKGAKCTTCHTTSGPWVVQGVKTWVENGLACANGDDAHLVCRQCHMKSVVPLAMQSTYMTDRQKYYSENK